MADRLSGEIRRTLKDVGVLGDDPGRVDASSAAQIIAAAVEQRDESEGAPDPIDVSPGESEEGPADE